MEADRPSGAHGSTYNSQSCMAMARMVSPVALAHAHAHAHAASTPGEIYVGVSGVEVLGVYLGVGLVYVK